MHERPLLSIITPTYNQEKFIGQCIESVLAQTYPNWEQIIIDDGSTDKTRDVIERYNDDRIIFVKQENKGIFKLGETYNKALEISRGKLIAILEGDDFWSPYKLERQIPLFESPETVLSWGRVAFVNCYGKTTRCWPNGNKWFDDVPKNEFIRRMIFTNFIPACTVMCRRDALVSIKGFHQWPHSPMVDYPTYLELSLVGKFSPVNEVLASWRQHVNQSSVVWTKEILETRNQIAMAFFESLPKEIKESLHISAGEMAKVCQNTTANMNFDLGRIKLYKKDWNGAKDNFRQAWKEGTFPLKGKASVGMICSYFRVDLEWAVQLMGRNRLSEAD